MTRRRAARGTHSGITNRDSAWPSAIYAGTRAMFRRTARRRAVAMQQLFDALVAEVEARLAARPAEPDAAT